MRVAPFSVIAMAPFSVDKNNVRIVCSVTLEGIGYRQSPKMQKRIKEVVVETDVVCDSPFGKIVGFSINLIEPNINKRI